MLKISFNLFHRSCSCHGNHLLALTALSRSTSTALTGPSFGDFSADATSITAIKAELAQQFVVDASSVTLITGEGDGFPNTLKLVWFIAAADGAGANALKATYDTATAGDPNALGTGLEDIDFPLVNSAAGVKLPPSACSLASLNPTLVPTEPGALLCLNLQGVTIA